MPAETAQWKDRQQPTIQLVDTANGVKDSPLPGSDGVQSQEYTDWLNLYRSPLHRELDTISEATENRLLEHHVDIVTTARVLSGITKTSLYPTQRIMVVDDAAQLAAYQEALAVDFFSAEPKYRSGERVEMDFVPPLHIVRLQTDYVNYTSPLKLQDTVARGIGMAMLAPVVNVAIEQNRDGSANAYWWFGTTWRHNDSYYGEQLLETAAIKLAAEARRHLGQQTRFAVGHPTVEPYRCSRGIPQDANGAVLLDVINTAAGNSDPLAIYRPLWQYARSGATDGNARQELQQMIGRATKNDITLEQLEQVTYSPHGFPLEILQRAEEACSIDVSRRPSAYISYTAS